MSIHIDAREVLKYLNQLGYYNITARQLKEFIRDLKILIKYDLKKENQENTVPPSENHYYPVNQKNNYNFENIVTEISANKDDKYLSEVFNYLHSTSTISSRAKTCPRKDNISNKDSIQILKPKPSRPWSGGSVSVSNKSECRDKSVKSDAFNIIIKNKGGYPEFKYLPSDNSDKHNTSKKSDNLSKNELKPRVSFIRPKKQVHISKSDPVTLYKKYQENWNKQKLPGEDKRYNLRWAIREKMLGEPDIIPRVPGEKLSKRSI